MLIDRLQLMTADLAAMYLFYHETLGLSVLHYDENQLALQAGMTELVFQQDSSAWSGRYHFAFNIPENQLTRAKDWLHARGVLLAQDEHGADEFDSTNWNAHMVYFYDPAGNILELIARHTLDNVTHQPFESHHLLSVSEIGLVTDDVLTLLGELKRDFGLELYQQEANPTFSAVGDAHGLFIVVKTGRVWFPNTGIAAKPLPLMVYGRNDSGRRFELISGPPYQLTLFGGSGNFGV